MKSLEIPIGGSFILCLLVPIIQKCFPFATPEYIDNLNDYSSSIDIPIRPFITMRVVGKNGVDEDYCVKITVYKIETWNYPITNCKEFKIFDGEIPFNKDKSDFDFDFIEKVIRNYDRFK